MSVEYTSLSNLVSPDLPRLLSDVNHTVPLSVPQPEPVVYFHEKPLSLRCRLFCISYKYHLISLVIIIPILIAIVAYGISMKYDYNDNVTTTGWPTGVPTEVPRTELPMGEVTVSTTAGVVMGEIEGMVKKWLGIPFAKPPVGTLRFAPPEVMTWDTPLHTTMFGASCMQKYSPYEPTVASENCLFLNIWTPLNSTRKSKKSVMVWIYGGSFTSGSGSLPVYDPTLLVEKDVIVVTFNYRLGIFGFASSDILAAEHEKYPSSGNYGLLDQKLALQFIRDNIENFGGDPLKITVFGESAGSMSICLHLVANKNIKLPQFHGDFPFSKAVMESGPCLQGSKPSRIGTWSYETGKYVTETVFSSLNCSTSKPDYLACIRNIDSSLIVKAQEVSNFAIGPVIDGTLLKTDPYLLFKDGLFVHMPLLLGNVANEGTSFIHNHNMTEDEYKLSVDSTFVNSSEILKQYPASRFDSPFYAAAEVFGDFLFVCPTIRLMKFASNKTDIFQYWFSHLPSFQNKALKVSHFSEVYFVFGDVFHLPSPLVPATPEELSLSSQIMNFWVSFAKDGTPYSKDSTEWHVARSPSYKYIQLDTPISVGSLLKQQDCNFWDSITN